MAITRTAWKSPYDIHLLAGEMNAPLNANLQLTHEWSGNRDFPFASDANLPASIQVSFRAEFKPEGAQPAGKQSGHGVELDTRTGAIKVSATLPEFQVDLTAAPGRLYNFIVIARAIDTSDNTAASEIPIRVHLHKSIARVWLTPAKLKVHAGTSNQQFTVLAEFDDGTMGDITERPYLSFSSNPAAVAKVHPKTGIVTHVSDGTAQVRVDVPATLGAAPSRSSTATVLARPSLATDRTLVRVRPRGRADFSRKANILLLPDGFTAAESHAFYAIVERIVYDLQKNDLTSPFNILKDSINYWRLADGDFLASQDANISLHSEAWLPAAPQPPIVSGVVPSPVRPSDNPAAPWSASNLVFKVGLPVPADAAKTLAIKLKEWNRLHDNIAAANNAQIQQGDFEIWQSIHRRSLLNERCTALGFQVHDHPRVDQDLSGSQVGLDPRRVGQPEFLAMIGHFRAGGDAVGASWLEGGKDYGRVCVIVRSEWIAGTEYPLGGYFASSLSDAQQQSVTPAQPPALGLDLIPWTLPQGSPLPIGRGALILAHECAHSFGLGDEYGSGDGISLPAERFGELWGYSNLQQQPTLAPTGDLNPGLAKWLLPRLTGAGVLEKAPEAAGGNFVIQLAPGHGAQFRADDSVQLRKKDYRTDGSLTTNFSAFFKVVEVQPNDRVIITPEGAPITLAAADFPKGSALVRPKQRPGKGRQFLIASEIALHMFSTNLPLNRTTATCLPARNLGKDDHDGPMTPVNLPAGLAPGIPANKQNIVGLYDGGHYHDCGVFHPAGLCALRSASNDDPAVWRTARFCHVCRYHIVDQADPTKHGELDAIYDKEYPRS